MINYHYRNGAPDVWMTLLLLLFSLFLFRFKCFVDVFVFCCCSTTALTRFACKGENPCEQPFYFHGQNDKRFLYQFISFRFTDFGPAVMMISTDNFYHCPHFFYVLPQTSILLFYLRPLLFIIRLLFIMFAHGIAVHSDHYPFLEGIPLPLSFAF